MSKHIFTQEMGDNISFTVEMGWDKPQQQFYCMIWSQPTEIDPESSIADDPIYSSVCESIHDRPLEYYIEKCKSYKVELPEKLIFAVREDKLNNAVNLIRFYP